MSINISRRCEKWDLCWTRGILLFVRLSSAGGEYIHMWWKFVRSERLTEESPYHKYRTLTMIILPDDWMGPGGWRWLMTYNKQAKAAKILKELRELHWYFPSARRNSYLVNKRLNWHMSLLCGVMLRQAFQWFRKQIEWLILITW